MAQKAIIYGFFKLINIINYTEISTGNERFTFGPFGM
jgi:hypothetical protein